jgi:hypothetical protein
VPGFFWQVTLIVYNQCGDSDTLTSTLASIGLEDPVSSGFQLSVYPVPADDELILEWSSTSNSELLWRLFDSSGRAVLSGGFEASSNRKDSIDVRNLPPGSYTLEWISGKDMSRRKILIE